MFSNCYYKCLSNQQENFKLNSYSTEKEEEEEEEEEEFFYCQILLMKIKLVFFIKQKNWFHATICQQKSLNFFSKMCKFMHKSIFCGLN